MKNLFQNSKRNDMIFKMAGSNVSSLLETGRFTCTHTQVQVPWQAEALNPP